MCIMFGECDKSSKVFNNKKKCQKKILKKWKCCVIEVTKPIVRRQNH